MTPSTLHCGDIRRVEENRVCLQTMFFCVDEKGDRGEESFYLLTKCYARAWISAFIVRLSSVWKICSRELVLLEKAQRESLICGGESPGGGIRDASDMREIHYGAKKIKRRGSITSITSRWKRSASLSLLPPCVAEVTRFFLLFFLE